MDNKLVVVITGQNCEKFIGMNLDSVKDADAIIYCDGGSTDKTIPIVANFHNTNGMHVDIIQNKWNSEDKAMNGKQRNFYLEYIKKEHPNDWCLVLDADELVEDLSKIKEFINDPDRRPGLYNVKMRHFIGDLGHEDATRPVHVVPARLFKISEAKGYPLHSHPVLEGELMGACLDTTIWHLGHLPVEYMDYILKRYKQHAEDSLIHTQEFLTQWKYSHLLGHYPSKEINPLELPKQIVERYEINTDMFYHSRYQLELKNAIMVKQWNDYFKPFSLLDLGCGRGCYLYFWDWFSNTSIGEGITDIKGIELSQWAVDNAFCENIVQGDISIEENIKCEWIQENKWDLITAIDVLEHLTDEQLDKTLKNMVKYGKRFLFSIPFEGDPNLIADNTHKQFHDRGWWVKKIESYGILIKDAPQDWLFAHQLLIGEKMTSQGFRKAIENAGLVGEQFK
jgi:glycosyltransferase involved in cell wall biosynthesis